MLSMKILLDYTSERYYTSGIKILISKIYIASINLYKFLLSGV